MSLPIRFLIALVFVARTSALPQKPGTMQKVRKVKTHRQSILFCADASYVFPKTTHAEDIDAKTVRLSFETTGNFDLSKQAHMMCVTIADNAPKIPRVGEYISAFLNVQSPTKNGKATARRTPDATKENTTAEKPVNTRQSLLYCFCKRSYAR